MMDQSSFKFVTAIIIIIEDILSHNQTNPATEKPKDHPIQQPPNLFIYSFIQLSIEHAFKNTNSDKTINKYDRQMTHEAALKHAYTVP
jgi:hypothetical protein